MHISTPIHTMSLQSQASIVRDRLAVLQAQRSQLDRQIAIDNKIFECMQNELSHNHNCAYVNKSSTLRVECEFVFTASDWMSDYTEVVNLPFTHTDGEITTNGVIVAYQYKWSEMIPKAVWSRNDRGYDSKTYGVKTTIPISWYSA